MKLQMWKVRLKRVIKIFENFIMKKILLTEMFLIYTRTLFW